MSRKKLAKKIKDDVEKYIPQSPKVKNGKRIALIGAGPASLTVARDLLPLGYECTIFEKDHKAGGLMRTNIPSFRLPADVLDEEIYRIINMGAELKLNSYIEKLKPVIDEYDSVFIGTGAPKGKDLTVSYTHLTLPTMVQV